MEIDILWAKAAVFVLMASFIFGFVKPEFLDIGRPSNWLDRGWHGVLAGMVLLAAFSVLLTLVFSGAMGVQFLLS